MSVDISTQPVRPVCMKSAFSKSSCGILLLLGDDYLFLLPFFLFTFAFYAQELTHVKERFNQITLRRHHGFYRLISSRSLVQSVRRLVTLHAFRGSNVILDCERLLGGGAAHDTT